MGSKLYVGNLSWNVTDDMLRSTFEQHGEVSEAVVISDRDTGRSRGFGFVTFVDSDSAQNAINALNGSDLDGRALNVNEAREREPRSGGGGGGRRERW